MYHPSIVVQKGENALEVIRSMLKLLDTYNMPEASGVYTDIAKLLEDGLYREAAAEYYWRKRKLNDVLAYLFVSDIAERKTQEHLTAVKKSCGNLRIYLDYGVDRPLVSLPEPANSMD